MLLSEVLDILRKTTIINQDIGARRLLEATFIKELRIKLTHTHRYKMKCVSVSGALQKKRQSHHDGNFSYSGAMHVV